jgi:hypothetical protein
MTDLLKLCGTQEPIYDHYCDKCFFLGHYENYDLYACFRFDGFVDDIIARYGSEEDEYISGIRSKQVSPCETEQESANELALRVAYLIALEHGFVKVSETAEGN